MNPDASNFIGQFGGYLVFYTILGVAIYLHVAICLSIMARKNGVRDRWMAWVPILNLLLMCRLAGKSGAWVFLLLVPFVNIIFFVIVWAGIAKARGKSPALGVMIIVPVIGILLVPVLLAAGEAAAPTPAGVPQAAASTALVCPICGSPDCVGSAFCAYTGLPMPKTQAAAPRTAIPANVPISRKRSSGFKIAGAAVLLIVFAVTGIVLYSSGMLTPRVARLTPQIPQRVAGTLKEFPVDTSGSGTPWKPTNVSVQPLGLGSETKLDVKNTPPGMTARVLNPIGSSITTSQYKRKPSDTPIDIGVVNTREAASSAIGPLAQAINSAKPGMQTNQVQIQSPQGVSYSGYGLKNSNEEVIIVGRPDANIVIYLFAPDRSVMEATEQLAANLGNGNGLYDDPEFANNISALPAQLPAGMELTELKTFSDSDLGLSLSELQAATGGGAGSPGTDWTSKMHALLPDKFTVARYVDHRGGSYHVISGEYGSTIGAWRSWLMLRGLASASGTQTVTVGSNSGISAADGSQYSILFQTGPHIVVIQGPGRSQQSVLQLGQALQL